jgi:hypothetical protein
MSSIFDESPALRPSDCIENLRGAVTSDEFDTAVARIEAFISRRVNAALRDAAARRQRIIHAPITAEEVAAAIRATAEDERSNGKPRDHFLLLACCSPALRSSGIRRRIAW